jgi:hypothetical protein
MFDTRSLNKIKVNLDEVEKGMPMTFNIVTIFHFEMFIFVINANCTLDVLEALMVWF